MPNEEVSGYQPLSENNFHCFTDAQRARLELRIQLGGKGW